MHFAMVIPALNEEQAIADTLRRVLAAREKVVSQTPVDKMTVVFVNDGSTDGTQEIVDQSEFNEVVKVRFEKNRGYGAAIKAGWQAVDADLVGFIDGDGTCDPDFAVKLINRLEETQADVVLAGRLNPESEMPLIRKIGNIIFARLLGLVSGKDLTDSASGFRVVRRSSLNLMSPLPDGLHFTPAMSCICLLDPRLRIEEVPMPYKERIGRSKLSVVKDGFRFLFIILFSACCYSPIKTMVGASGIIAAICAMAMSLLYISGANNGAMTMTALTGLMLMMLLVGTGVVVHQLNFLLIGPRRHMGVGERLLQYFLGYRRLMGYGVTTAVVGLMGLMIWGSTDGRVGVSGVSGVSEGVSNLAMGAMLTALAVAGGWAWMVGVMVRVIWAVGEKQKALIHDQYRPPGISAPGISGIPEAGTHEGAGQSAGIGPAGLNSDTGTGANPRSNPGALGGAH